MVPFFLLGVILLLLVLTDKKKKNFPPGPRSSPFVGNSFLLKELSEKCGGQYLAFSELAKRYKTNVLGLKLGRTDVVVIFSYELIKKALTDVRFDGRPKNFFMKLRCMGTLGGITSIDGPKWSTQRKFLVRHLRYLGYGGNKVEEAIREELLDVIRIIQSNPEDTRITKLLAPSVVNILLVLISGRRESRDAGKLEYLLDLFRRRSRIFDMTGGLLNSFPFLRFICPEWCGYNLIVKINEEIREFFLKTIREHCENWEEGKDGDFIDAFISEMRKNNDKDFSEEQLMKICFDIFLAGSETTSNSLDFAFLNMILNPEVQKKVQECIDEAVGSKDITYEDRHRMPYVEAVLHESERLCTIGPIGGPRRATDEVILDGYTIPKDATVLLSHHSVHKSVEIWGDPEVFRPERFLTEDGHLQLTEFLVPFSIGRRRCLGEDFARAFIFHFFTGLLREFSVVASPPGQKLSVTPIPGLTSAPMIYTARFVKRF